MRGGNIGYMLNIVLVEPEIPQNYTQRKSLPAGSPPAVPEVLL